MISPWNATVRLKVAEAQVLAGKRVLEHLRSTIRQRRRLGQDVEIIVEYVEALEARQQEKVEARDRLQEALRTAENDEGEASDVTMMGIETHEASLPLRSKSRVVGVR